MVTLVVALGGSLLRPEVEDRNEWLINMVSIIKSRVMAGDRIGLVLGGGAPAREGIALAKSAIDELAKLDRVGIAATRLNATIFREALSSQGISISKLIPETIDRAVLELEKYGLVVMGGTEPGHTTDTVAISLAIEAGARKCIIATNVSKVFAEDPKENPDSESFDRLTLTELQNIVGEPEHSGAGKSQVVDPIGVDKALRHNIDLDILDGRDTDKIRKSLQGEEFDGTMVRGE
ncbi:MAG: UMP kinase [Euryarchaeota archaeon]|nr:UMP kinase [Euryarchaeota archaeon]MBJ28842.1 UMP kinase [Euryarchaeota archaeon]|tara:strand:- start:211 stop:915 length:705 start_codon:yes stop_codon:yes gene_type:complete